ncbi:MAG: hypothetical protein FJ318_00615 [SAR202 cluster bacterium]|nr:hypothetical protein [SAR202 cluster bacterium]
MTNEQPIPNLGIFHAGDIVHLRDRKGRRYRLRLEPGKTYHMHVGFVAHDDVIGKPDGSYVATSGGHRLLAIRPTLLEAVLEMPRESQVIYPKDLAAILMHGDIYPGAKVVEVGLGSGATSATILRAIGPRGSLTTYEVREEIVGKAKRNIAELAPDHGNHTVVLCDAYESGIRERGVDRILTDVPEPWRLVDSAAEALRPGGILLFYLPTVLQVHQAGMALTLDRRFQLVEHVEVLERPWHIADRSARPEHRMVAHTGFITTARRCEPSVANAARP